MEKVEGKSTKDAYIIIWNMLYIYISFFFFALLKFPMSSEAEMIEQVKRAQVESVMCVRFA